MHRWLILFALALASTGACASGSIVSISPSPATSVDPVEVQYRVDLNSGPIYTDSTSVSVEGNNVDVNVKVTYKGFSGGYAVYATANVEALPPGGYDVRLFVTYRFIGSNYGTPVLEAISPLLITEAPSAVAVPAISQLGMIALSAFLLVVVFLHHLGRK